jgi:hypothetical protein
MQNSDRHDLVCRTGDLVSLQTTQTPSSVIELVREELMLNALNTSTVHVTHVAAHGKPREAKMGVVVAVGPTSV